MVLEYRVNQTLPSGGPGLSVFHGRIQTGSGPEVASQQLADRVRTFFDGVKALFNSGISWQFPGEVLELDTTTGVLTGVHAVTPPANVVGTGSAAMAAPAGAKVRWFTPAIVAGRRLQGGTFLVPLMTSSYESNGTLLGSSITVIDAAAAAFIDTSLWTNAAPSVYSRTHGIQADITSRRTPDRVSVLRSRRD